MKTPFTGGCMCCAIRYECLAEPIVMVHCHCRDCQRATVNHELNYIAVPPSAMDTPIDRQPVAHFYIRSQTSWFAIDDDAQQYKTSPPGGIREVYERVISGS
jgi:hypothetical protein